MAYVWNSAVPAYAIFCHSQCIVGECLIWCFTFKNIVSLCIRRFFWPNYVLYVVFYVGFRNSRKTKTENQSSVKN